jgi:lysophospholipase L1-like esterase
MKHLGLALLAIALLGGCATPVSSFTFAVAGDSLTAWDNQTFPHPDGDFSTVTWTHWAIGPDIHLAGGFAREDLTAAQIAENMVAVDADVLVVLAGTNDVGVTPVADVLEGIQRIVETSGMSTVLISALPPVDGSAEYNAALETLAASQNWGFVDPWVSLRREDGEWLDGSSNDGVHPTPDSAKVVGAAIVAAMRELLN